MAKHPRTGAGRPHLSVSQLLAETATALDRGDVRLGARHLGEALRSDPANPLVHLAVGSLNLKTGILPDAEAAFNTALNLNPDAVEAAAGLVKVCVAKGRPDEAEALCQDYLTRFPNNLLLGQLHAQILIDQHRTVEAIQVLRSLVDVHRTAVTSINTLAKRLSEQGYFDDSRMYFERAIAVDQTNSFAYLGWAQTKSVSGEDMEMVRAMEAALSIRSLGDVDRMQILFALGKAYADLEDFQVSMDSYRKANEIREAASQNGLPFDTERIQGILDLTREIFTKPNIELRQSDYNSLPTPIFIVGMFRSGTTLVEQILSNHSEVVAGGEIPYWMDVSAACFDRSRRSFDFERVKALRKPYQLKLNGLSDGARFVTDKMPGNYRLLGLLRILFPRAKFIHCTRHPVDTCLSIYMTPFNTPPNYASDPEKLVFNYRIYRQTMDHWRAVLTESEVHEVRYEDLIEDPDSVTRKMLSFCDLEFEQACLSPESNQRTVTTASSWQVRQPIYRSSVQKWRQYEPWLGEFRTLME